MFLLLTIKFSKLRFLREREIDEQENLINSIVRCLRRAVAAWRPERLSRWENNCTAIFISILSHVPTSPFSGNDHPSLIKNFKKLLIYMSYSFCLFRDLLNQINKNICQLTHVSLGKFREKWYEEDAVPRTKEIRWRKSNNQTFFLNFRIYFSFPYKEIKYGFIVYKNR